jgi:hypothetical protein
MASLRKHQKTFSKFDKKLNYIKTESKIQKEKNLYLLKPSKTSIKLRDEKTKEAAKFLAEEKLKKEMERISTKKFKVIRRKNRVLARHRNIKFSEDGHSKAVLNFTEKVYPKLKLGQGKAPP